jgi:hypothetical protein
MFNGELADRFTMAVYGNMATAPSKWIMSTDIERFLISATSFSLQYSFTIVSSYIV